MNACRAKHPCKTCGESEVESWAYECQACATARGAVKHDVQSVKYVVRKTWNVGRLKMILKEEMNNPKRISKPLVAFIEERIAKAEERSKRQ